MPSFWSSVPKHTPKPSASSAQPLNLSLIHIFSDFVKIFDHTQKRLLHSVLRQLPILQNALRFPVHESMVGFI